MDGIRDKIHVFVYLPYTIIPTRILGKGYPFWLAHILQMGGKKPPTSLRGEGFTSTWAEMFSLFVSWLNNNIPCHHFLQLKKCFPGGQKCSYIIITLYIHIYIYTHIYCSMHFKLCFLELRADLLGKKNHGPGDSKWPFYPNVGFKTTFYAQTLEGQLTFERVTISPSQKGHELAELPGVVYLPCILTSYK